MLPRYRRPTTVRSERGAQAGDDRGGREKNDAGGGKKRRGGRGAGQVALGQRGNQGAGLARDADERRHGQRQ